MSRHLMARMRRTASPVFDWRRSPEYDSPGISADHHSAPLENGDRLHAYRLNFNAINPWVFEIEPHDMPPRLPLRFHDGVNGDLPRKAVPMAIARNPAVDPVGTDRTRRNFSLWGRRPDPDGGEHPGNWENGTSYTSLSEAVSAAEGRYLEEAPKWGAREPRQRGGFDYDAFFGTDRPDGDDFGDIFGGGR